MYVYVQRSEVNVMSSLYQSHLLVCKETLNLGLYDWLASEPRIPFLNRVTDAHKHVRLFHMDSEDQNSGLHACSVMHAQKALF